MALFYIQPMPDTKKYLGHSSVHTSRFLMYVWQFFKIMQDMIKYAIDYR